MGELKLEKNPEKTFIGRVSRGFDFLGYLFSPASLQIALKFSHFSLAFLCLSRISWLSHNSLCNRRPFPYLCYLAGSTLLPYGPRGGYHYLFSHTSFPI